MPSQSVPLLYRTRYSIQQRCSITLYKSRAPLTAPFQLPSPTIQRHSIRTMTAYAAPADTSYFRSFGRQRNTLGLGRYNPIVCCGCSPKFVYLYIQNGRCLTPAQRSTSENQQCMHNDPARWFSCLSIQRADHYRRCFVLTNTIKRQEKRTAHRLSIQSDHPTLYSSSKKEVIAMGRLPFTHMVYTATTTDSHHKPTYSTSKSLGAYRHQFSLNCFYLTVLLATYACGHNLDCKNPPAITRLP